MKKKNIMFAMAIVTIATCLTMKANNERPMSNIVLANVEALNSNESDYYCYGKGDVVCPYTGEMVAGYFKMRNIE